jgi:hypothetical protein
MQRPRPTYPAIAKLQIVRTIGNVWPQALMNVIQVTLF